MTAITDAGNATFRDFTVAGVPASGAHEPEKAQIRQLVGLIDATLASLGVNGAITVKYAALGFLNSDLNHAANTLAVVYNDPNPAVNGIYAKLGASGTGSWAITPLALPATFATDIAAVLTQTEAVVSAAAAFGGAAAQIGDGSGVVVYEDEAFAVRDRSEFKGDPGGDASSVGTLDVAATLSIPSGIDQVSITGGSAVGDALAGMVLVEDGEVDADFVAANPTTSFRDADGRGFRRRRLDKTPNLQPARTLRVFGDSKGAGANASGAVDHATLASPVNVNVNAWAALARRELALKVVNYSVGGNEILEQAGQIFAHPPEPGDLVAIEIGANDEKTKTTAVQLQVFREALRAGIVFAAAQGSVITAADMDGSGTWATSPGSVFPFSRVSSTVGAIRSGVAAGDTVAVAALALDPDVYPRGTTYQVRIDGAIMGTYPVNPAEGFESGQGTLIAPRCHLYTGLGDREHEVEFEVTAVDGQGPEIGFIAGIGRARALEEPQVYVFTSARQTAAGYLANGGSDAAVRALNAVIREEVDWLAGLGVPVALVDVETIIDPASHISGDGIHENDAGHRLYADALIAAATGLVRANDRQAVHGLRGVMTPFEDHARFRKPIALAPGQRLYLTSEGQIIDPNWSMGYTTAPTGDLVNTSAAFIEVYPAGARGLIIRNTDGDVLLEVRGDGAAKVHGDLYHGGRLRFADDAKPSISDGAGSPEGVVAAAIGSTYHRTDGGAGTSFYVKESGTGNTGWVAK